MITTHVLDLSSGKPAAGVRVTLARFQDGKPVELGAGSTDADGRLRTLVPPGTRIAAGEFQLAFETGAYFDERGEPAFHPRVVVRFTIPDAGEQHYHVPLLISPFGYTTYRGS